MKTIVPDYYREFKCTAGNCSHSCCAEGWEIDIDKSAEARYRHEIGKRTENGEKTAIGRKLEKAVKFGKPSHFVPEGKICPFFNKDGLCELILYGGDKMLCQICADHPRFRNFYDDHIEMGVGLCCEEAARLIVTHKGPVRYEYLEPSSEPASERIIIPEFMKCAVAVPERPDMEKICNSLLEMEILNEEWRDILRSVRDSLGKPLPGFFDIREWAERFLRIKEYLLYRHLKSDGLLFAEISLSLIIESAKCEVLGKGEMSLERFLRLVGIFSSEIEYSEEAIGFLRSVK